MDEYSDTESLTDRETIRENLSTMSFEELQKLKEKIGAKLYNKTMFGENNKTRKRPAKEEFKRENKNRPREMSSKRPVFQHKEVISVKKHIARDPRFDPLCGTFNEKEFKKSYKFIHDVKVNERKILKEELKETTDPERKRKIEYLIQRIDNQIREKEKNEMKKEKLIAEKKEIREKLKMGEKPEYHKKSDKKILDLVSKYEELKQNKKLQKHIEKRSKKVSRKDFKRMRDTLE